MMMANSPCNIVAESNICMEQLAIFILMWTAGFMEDIGISQQFFLY